MVPAIISIRTEGLKEEMINLNPVWNTHLQGRGKQWKANELIYAGSPWDVQMKFSPKIISEVSSEELVSSWFQATFPKEIMED